MDKLYDFIFKKQPALCLVLALIYLALVLVILPTIWNAK